MRHEACSARAYGAIESRCGAVVGDIKEVLDVGTGVVG